MKYTNTAKKTQSPSHPFFNDLSFLSRKSVSKKGKKEQKTTPKSEVVTCAASPVKSYVKECRHEKGGALLGINTESSPTFEFDHRDLRRERYALQNIARGIFGREGERKGLKYVLNYHRAAHCAYTLLASDVGVWESIEYKKAHYDGNVMFCGSASACPCCTVKIQERRRGEIATAIDHFYKVEKGKKAMMITFTFPHGFDQKLKDLLGKQKLAFEKLRRGRVFDLFKNRVGYDGLIRSLEVTYGSNGWHPHTHELWFMDQGADSVKVKEFLTERWLKVCGKVGLVDLDDPQAVANFRAHAVDVKDNASTSAYLAKMDDSKHWGADREMAKASSKKGKKSGLHPFSFLTKFEETKDPVWALRWLEYCEAFKGKRLVYFSQGLKKRVGLEEKSDEEIASEKDDQAVEIIRLSADLWKKVRRNNLQAMVLDVCESTKNKMVIESVINNHSSVKFDLIESIDARLKRKEIQHE